MAGGDDLTVQINLAPIEMLPSIMNPANGKTQQPTETTGDDETDDAEEPTTATNDTENES
jgi:hypothetical protein